MNRHRAVRLVLLAAILSLSSACSRHEPLHQAQLYTMGTLVNISLWLDNDKQAEQAMQLVEQQLSRFSNHWHAWQPSELTRINQAIAAGKTASLTGSESVILKQAQQLAARSDHLFNPAIGRLIALWGFHSDERPDDQPPPDPASRQALVAAQPRMSDLDITDSSLSSRNPAVQIDLGAFAKGVAVDRAIALLREQGIDNAIVNAGGDLRAIGRAGQRPWRIGIRHPQNNNIIAAIETRQDESIFTSGNYERFFTYRGQRYHHLIDPRSGAPATGTLSVTVIRDEAATADAAATALFVAGPKLWPKIARQMAIQYVMLIDTDMNIYMTPAMAERVKFTDGKTYHTIITAL